MDGEMSWTESCHGWKIVMDAKILMRKNSFESKNTIIRYLLLGDQKIVPTKNCVHWMRSLNFCLI